MASAACTLPPLGDLRIDGSPRGELVTSSPVEGGGAQLETLKLGTGGEGEKEVRSEDVEAYEQKIQAALSAEITEEGRAKAQDSLRSFLLHNPSQQCLVRTPSEKHLVENAEAVEQIVAVLAKAEFPGAPETKEAVGAVGVSALANSLASLFQKVHDSLPLLTVSVAKTQHHFTNPFMAGYQSPEGTLPPAQHSTLPPLTPESKAGGAPTPRSGPTTPPIIPKNISRGPPTPPVMPRSLAGELLVAVAQPTKPAPSR